MSPVKRIILSAILAIVFCQLAFVFIKREIDKYQIHNTGRMQELLYNKTNYDVLFIGSSRTHLTINPAIIDSICHVNSYNAGIEGGNLFEFNMMLKAYLQNHPAPKWLVLTLDLHSFVADYKFFNYAQYFSYTKNKIIKDYLDHNGYNTLRLRVFPFLELTDYDDNMKGYFVKGLMGYSEIPEGDFQYKGYLSNTQNQVDTAAPVSAPVNVEIANSRKGCLVEIMNTCNTNHIKIIFTYAPEYKHKIAEGISNNKEVFDVMNDFAAEKNIPFFRHDSLNICNNPGLFANPGHLNRNGADIYSSILAEHLNKIIKREH